MRETLKKYSPKPENINLGWFNKHLTNPEIWKWNKKTISRAFAIGLFLHLFRFQCILYLWQFSQYFFPQTFFSQFLWFGLITQLQWFLFISLLIN